MIGIDIVDLQLAEKESNWQRKGFLDKQFTDKEKLQISKSDNPLQLVWLFWTMKEAAYKIWCQQNNKREFSPKKFQCDLTSEDKGLVSVEHEIYHTTSMLDGYFIHTLACLDKNAKVTLWIGHPFAIEEQIKKELEKKTGKEAIQMEKRKSSLGVPNYYFKDQCLTKSCSISHHGNYGSFSFLIE